MFLQLKPIGIYVKRLGQRHYYSFGDSETYCGMPMLGNNYAKLITENEQKECIECRSNAESHIIEEKLLGENDGI